MQSMLDSNRALCPGKFGRIGQRNKAPDKVSLELKMDELSLDSGSNFIFLRKINENQILE